MQRKIITTAEIAAMVQIKIVFVGSSKKDMTRVDYSRSTYCIRCATKASIACIRCPTCLGKIRHGPHNSLENRRRFLQSIGTGEVEIEE
jgi:hypothetical protein